MIRALALAVALAIAGAAGAQTPVTRFDSLSPRLGEAVGEMFYTAYLTADPARDRPLAFVFNGGPGAASIFLHLGGIGPTRLAANDDTPIAPGPVALAANAESWFAFTDLVFIDPVGTGWSRPVEGDAVAFWGVEQDAAMMARFIVAYLARHPAEGRPIHLIGESYGGYRAVRVAQLLTRERVAIAGLTLISPVIDFATILGDGPNDLLASVARLPAYAAAAWSHGRVGQEPRTAESRAAFLAEAERFAVTEFLPALAQGAALAPDETARLHARIARMIGLPVDQVARYHGRVPREAFMRGLLANDNRVLGAYDASIAGPRNGGDPSLAPVAGRLGPAARLYFDKMLRVVAPREDYVVLNRRMPQVWDYVGPRTGIAAPPAGSPALTRMMIDNPALRVLVANGRHDLVTTYFGTATALRQMRLDETQRARLTHLVTDGGHMIYLHPAARAALFAAARAQFETTRP